MGRAIAERCVAEGMQVVLADVEPGALDRVADDLRRQGGEVMPVLTDVSHAESVEALERQTRQRYIPHDAPDPRLEYARGSTPTTTWPAPTGGTVTRWPKVSTCVA